jgi:hypothetical protein
MTDLEHGLRAINEHLARWRDEVRGLPLRGSYQRARLRQLEARALAAAKKISEARAAVEHALVLIHDPNREDPAKSKPSSMRTTLAALVLVLVPVCGPIAPEPVDDIVQDDETTTSSSGTSSTGPDSSSGGAEMDFGSGSGSGGEDGDPACHPVIDVLGTVIGSVCPCDARLCSCFIEQQTGVCLESCGKGCPDGLECRPIVLDQQLRHVCWPI